jgi:hypothetical protein
MFLSSLFNFSHDLIHLFLSSFCAAQSV